MAPEQGAGTSHRAVNAVSGRGTADHPDDLHCRTVPVAELEQQALQQAETALQIARQQEIAQSQRPWTPWRRCADQEPRDVAVKVADWRVWKAHCWPPWLTVSQSLWPRFCP